MISFSLDDLTATHYFLSFFEDPNNGLFTNEANKLRRHLEKMIENLNNVEQFTKFFLKFSTSENLTSFQAKLTPVNALKNQAKKLIKEIDGKKSSLKSPQTIAQFKQAFNTAFSSVESSMSALDLLKKKSSDLATIQAAQNTAKPIIISRNRENAYQISGTPGSTHNTHLYNGNLPGERISISSDTKSLERNRVSENARAMIASILENVTRGGICQFRITAGNKKVEITPISTIREKLIVTLHLLADRFYDLTNGSPDINGLNQALANLNHPLLSANNEVQLRRFLLDVQNNTANQAQVEANYQITSMDATALLGMSNENISLMNILAGIKLAVIAQMLANNRTTLNSGSSSNDDKKRSHDGDDEAFNTKKHKP